jgi:hypothetical protein
MLLPLSMCLPSISTPLGLIATCWNSSRIVVSQASATSFGASTEALIAATERRGGIAAF